MTACSSCERSGVAMSTAVSHMCVRCWLNLPQVTRELYLHGGLSLGRVTEMAKERRRSVRELRADGKQ